MKKNLTFLLLTLLVGVVNAQILKTINVATPGTLYSYVNENEIATITNLTISGNINYTDFHTMTSMPLLNVLDLSGATIKAYTEQGGNYRLFLANELPNNSFDNTVAKPSQIKLPDNLTSIGGGSFSWDTNLESITIPASVVQIGAFAFNYCSMLKKIILQSTTPPALGTGISRIVFSTDGTMINLPTIYVPVGCVNTYKNSTDMDIWKQFNIYESILTISTQNITNITLSSATLNGSIEFISSPKVNAYGFCWNTTGSPTVVDSNVDLGSTTMPGAYNYIISNLQPATTYYIRAYAKDGTGTVYGNDVLFKTASIPSAAGTINGLQTVCQGQNSVTYTIPAIAYATSYIWTLPTGVTGTSTTNNINVNYSKIATSGNITVKGHNEWGDGITSSIAITVNLLPNAGTISGKTSVCQGETSVNYTVDAIDNTTSYSWTLPNGATGTSTTNSINVNYGATSVSGNITVKGHNDCGDGIVSSLPIIINQLPVISVTDKTIICGGSVSLNATTNYSGNGTVNYQWSPTTGLNDATIANPTATVIHDITYTVTISTPTSCSISKSLLVSIIPMAKPEIGMVGVSSNNKNLIAWNKPASIGIESYNIYRETNVTNVYEKIGTVPYDSLSIYIDNQSLPDVQSNKYKLSIFDRHGLESSQSNSHKTMHLAINKGIGNAWNLSWEAYEGFVVSTYNIYRGATLNSLTLLGSTSGSNTQYNDLNAPSGDIYYQLEVISPNSVNPTKVLSSQKTKAEENGLTNSLILYSSSRSNIATNVFSSNIESGDNNKINIYPNPVKNELRIDFEGGSIFEILNLMGQVVYNGNLIKNTIVQTSNLSSGVYLIKFKSGKLFEYKKIIKE